MENFLPCPLSNQEVYAEELHTPRTSETCERSFRQWRCTSSTKLNGVFKQSPERTTTFICENMSSIIGADRNRIGEGNADSPFAGAFHAQGKLKEQVEQITLSSCRRGDWGEV
jgi:hypothetical protein